MATNGTVQIIDDREALLNYIPDGTGSGTGALVSFTGGEDVSFSRIQMMFPNVESFTSTPPLSSWTFSGFTKNLTADTGSVDGKSLIYDFS